jgi:hypothetical protein
MPTTAKPDQLLFRFPSTDSRNGITRLTQEKLAAEVLLDYQADDSELSSAQLAAIRNAEPQGKARSVKSSVF